MCAMAMLLSDMQGLDTQKAMKMVILHDLAESVVGDFIPGDVAAKQKVAQEKDAMASILRGLPKKVQAQYKKIWLEYLQSKTGVARFVHRLDKLEMALQAERYAQQGYASELLAPFFQTAKVAVGRESDIISEILNGLKNPKLLSSPT